MHRGAYLRRNEDGLPLSVDDHHWRLTIAFQKQLASSCNLVSCHLDSASVCTRPNRVKLDAELSPVLTVTSNALRQALQLSFRMPGVMEYHRRLGEPTLDSGVHCSRGAPIDHDLAGSVQHHQASVGVGEVLLAVG